MSANLKLYSPSSLASLLAIAALSALALSTTAKAQDGPLAGLFNGSGSITTAQAEAAARLQFEKLDVNHDGVVTESEFVDSRMQLFQAADTNGDGQVTRAEVRALVLSRASR